MLAKIYKSVHDYRRWGETPRASPINININIKLKLAGENHLR